MSVAVQLNANLWPKHTYINHLDNCIKNLTYHYLFYPHLGHCILGEHCSFLSFHLQTLLLVPLHCFITRRHRLDVAHRRLVYILPNKFDFNLWQKEKIRTDMKRKRSNVKRFFKKWMKPICASVGNLGFKNNF